MGTNDTSVTWSVLESVSGGTISATGLFTAANNPGTYHVIATSVADTTKSASATVAVQAVQGITINPAATYLGVAGMRTFTVAPAMPVTWAVAEGSVGGTIAQTGSYTAPATTGTYHVVATETANTINTAIAAITVVQSGFAYVGSMSQPRAAHTATLLSDGTVLVIDGGYFDIDDILIPIASAELFDPSVDHFVTIQQPLVGREFHTATILQSGKVLIAGGDEFSGYPTNTPPTQAAELYDPTTGTFANTGSMVVARSGHTATLLSDGRVLVVGGSSDARAEIYDPTTETFSTTGSMAVARSAHTATMLPSGKVLIVGGKDGAMNQAILTTNALATSEIYDPQSGSFTLSGNLSSAREGHTATLLSNGSVLVIGGANTEVLASTEIYDPPTGQFVAGPNLAVPRTNHTATALADGTVLVVGGIPMVPEVYVGYAPTPTAEIYDPGSRSFVQTGSMADGRFWHTSTLLRDGRVLVIGGGHSDAPLFGSDSVATAEVYR
ncbi:MAG TPA: kelch repeat-containing protein [Candidatus Acidoferrales bacterium]|nr:kelch repeat-containing protein [Candidatus Acidoferrales bacterium]